jgi:hypothetical protein
MTRQKAAIRPTIYLLVRALLIGHVEDADRAGTDAAARERRVADEHQRIEGVAILSQRSLDEGRSRRDNSYVPAS